MTAVWDVLRENSAPLPHLLAPLTCRLNLTASLLARGLCGGPDVPTHHRTDHDRASLLTDYNRKTSVDSAGGSLCDSTTSSEYSDLVYADSQNGEISSLYSDDDCQEVVKEILQHEQPTRITIKLHVTENKFTEWDSVLNPINNILYVAMPEILPPEASKQTFISLLEFAEEKLEVDAVVLAIRKNMPNRTRFVETFLIMGFQPLSRKSELAPPAAENDCDNFFLIYHIED